MSHHASVPSRPSQQQPTPQISFPSADQLLRLVGRTLEVTAAREDRALGDGSVEVATCAHDL